jgi:lipopolysaccharide exporter
MYPPHGRRSPAVTPLSVPFLSIGAHIRGFINQLRHSAFVKNLLIVMSGTALAQVIGFALSPVLSRLFTPADFGVFGAFTSLVGIVVAGATLEYTQAIMLPEKSGDAINLFGVSCISALAIGGMGLVCLLFSPVILQRVIPGESRVVLALLVGAAIAGGVNKSLQAWCVRIGAFKDTSVSQVVRSLSSNGAQAGSGWMGVGSVGLMVSAVVSEVLASANLLRVFLADLKELRHFIRLGRMWELAKEYRDFPMYAASQNVINAISVGLPVLLLAHFYGIAVAGAYAFGMRVLGAPMALVSTGLRQVVFHKACETQRHGGSLISLFTKITAGLAAQALIPALILLLWAPPLFVFLFGDQWHLAGNFAQSLVVWLLFAFCNLPAVLFGRLIRIQRTIFLLEIVSLSLRSFALIIGGYGLSSMQTVTLFALVGASTNLVLIYIVGSRLTRMEGQGTQIALQVL